MSCGCCNSKDECSCQSNCGCGSSGSCGCSSSCSCGCQKSCHEGKYSEELLKLADQAWMELLKEKIKEEIKELSNDHLNQMAKLVANANHLRWKEKLQAKKGLHDFEDQLKSLCCSQCCKTGKS